MTKVTHMKSYLFQSTCKRYYSLGIIIQMKEEKCLAQTWSQTKSSGIDLPEDLVIDKGIDQKYYQKSRL